MVLERKKKGLAILQRKNQLFSWLVEHTSKKQQTEWYCSGVAI